MAWFKDRDEKVDPKLQGKSQADILKMMEEAEKATARAAELEKERVAERETVNTLNSQFAAIRGKLETIEKNNQPPPPKAEPDIDHNFIDDPDAAFNQRAKPLAQMTVATAIAQARMLAQSELDSRDLTSNGTTHDGRLYRQWRAEIEGYANQKPQLELANPQTWVDLYLKVKGLHVDELANPETRKKNYAFMESAASSAPPTPEDKSKLPAEQQLSAMELKVAAGMKMTPEAYLKRKQSLQFVGA